MVEGLRGKRLRGLKLTKGGTIISVKRWNSLNEKSFNYQQVQPLNGGIVARLNVWTVNQFNGKTVEGWTVNC